MKEWFSLKWFSTPTLLLHVPLCQLLPFLFLVCTPLQAKDPPGDPVLVNRSIRLSEAENERVDPLVIFNILPYP